MGELLPDCLPKFLRPNYGLNNGLLFNEIFIPEEVLLHIISFITPQDLLKCSFVCHKWNQLIKSHALWAVIYKRRYNRRARKLPWYFYYSLLSENYFDTNLLKNGSGEEAFNYWTISSYGDGFTVEHLPLNAEPLPANVPELKDHSTCFVSAGGTCSKSQTIKLGRSKLFQYILHNYKPHIYVSDLMASGFNCDCVYILECTFLNKSGVEIAQSTTRHNVFQGDGSGWKKIEMVIRDYADRIDSIIFKHTIYDPEIWDDNYGSKMTGGVVKIIYDSIESLPVDERYRKPRLLCSLMTMCH